MDFSSKVNKVDYLIRKNDTVEVKDLHDIISDLNFDEFTVNFQSGYDSIPMDLQNAIGDLVGIQLAKQLGKDIKSETT